MVDDDADHLVVLMHGLHGDSSDFDAHVSILRSRGFLTHTARCNIGRTHDGIIAGGLRLADDISAIINELESSNPVRRLSVIGHSLGGQYCRYALGVLWGRGVFHEGGQGGEGLLKIQLVNFIGVTSPMLGIRRPRWGWAGFNSIFVGVARAIHASGQQLCLEDGQGKFVIAGGSGSGTGTVPVLVQLVRDDFIRALEAFQHRVVIANVFNDIQVPFCTASIRTRNPYRSSNVSPDVAEEMHVTRASLAEPAGVSLCAGEVAGAAEAAAEPQPELKEEELRPPESGDETLVRDKTEQAFGREGQRHRRYLQEMVNVLQGLPWRRVDVVFASFFAHEQVISKRGWKHRGRNNGMDIVRFTTSAELLMK